MIQRSECSEVIQKLFLGKPKVQSHNGSCLITYLSLETTLVYATVRFAFCGDGRPIHCGPFRGLADGFGSLKWGWPQVSRLENKLKFS